MPNDSETLHLRANTYLELKRYDEAMADIDKAIKIDPERYSFYFTRGMIYEAQGMKEKARADYRYACDNGESGACEAMKKLKGGK